MQLSELELKNKFVTKALYTSYLNEKVILTFGWIILQALLFTSILIGQHYCDREFYDYALKIHSGSMPFHNFSVEYPPLTLVIIWLASLPPLAIASYRNYAISFAILMAVFDLSTFIILIYSSKNATWSGSRFSPYIYLFLLFTNGAVLQKFDIIVGLLSIASIILVSNNRSRSAWVCLAGAALIKGYPLFLVPILVLFEVKYHKKKINGIITESAGGIILCLLGVLIMLSGGIRNLESSFNYHATRGFEIESLGANILLLGKVILNIPATTVYASDLSRDVISPLTNSVELGMYILFGIFLAALYYRAFRIFADRNNEGDQFSNILALSIAAFMLFFLSFRALPQHYLLAVIPLLALLKIDKVSILAIISATLGQVAGQVLIAHWPMLVDITPSSVIILTFRNICFVGILVFLVYRQRTNISTSKGMIQRVI